MAEKWVRYRMRHQRKEKGEKEKRGEKEKEYRKKGKVLPRIGEKEIEGEGEKKSRQIRERKGRSD